MIFRYFPYGSKKFALKCKLTGNKGGLNAVNYVRGDKDHTGEFRKVLPELMKGDPDLMVHLLSEGKYANEYVSGVLRFTEKDLSKKFLYKIIEEHERMSLPGLEPHQYGALWYLHRDKDDIELHFIYSKEELTTGKKLAPYVMYKMGSKEKNDDYYKMDHWQNAINAEYNLGDPKHPLNRQAISEADIRLPFLAKASFEAINEEVERRINKGLIKDRATLIDELNSMDLEISRITKKSISIKVEGRKAPIRLKGKVYEEGFTIEDFEGSALEKEAKAYDDDRLKRAIRERAKAERIYKYQAENNKVKYKQNEGKVLRAKFYSLVDDEIKAGNITSRKQIIELLKSQNKVIEVVDTYKHYISVYYQGGARPFRMEGEPFKREGNIDEYLQTLLDSKEKSDHKLEERRKQEEAFYFNKEFGSLDFVRMKDTKWNEFAQTMQNENTMKEHINLKYDIMFNQSDNITKTNIEANSDMTEFDLSIFRAYANDPNFELTDDNNKENENGIDYKRNNERTERIIKELVERKPARRSFSQYIKDSFDGIKGALKSISRNYRRGYEDIRNTRQKTERYGEELRRKIDSNREKARNNDRAFTETIRAFEKQLAVMEKQASYNKKKGSNFRPN